MRRKEFIDIILNNISDKFDIYHNYWFENKKFVIYAYNYSYDHKLSSDEVRLNLPKSYEHLFFVNCDNLGVNEFNELYNFAVNKIEPHFVRGDNKLPAKNHMFSYISFIIITRNQPSEEVCNMIKNCNWSKGYLFNARGFCNIRMVCVTPSKYNVISNKYGTAISDFLMELMLHMEHYED